MATAALAALRRAHPQAQIAFAVGSWSKPVLAGHPDIDEFLDTGAAALPTASWPGIWRFAAKLRAGKFDLAISLVRSARMSLALLLSGIPLRAGIDSGGRGFGYQVRARINAAEPRHESDIYLDVPRALGVATEGCAPNLPLLPAAADSLAAKLAERGISAPYLALHPGGGANPGARQPDKRWPLAHFAEIARRLAERWRARPLWLVGAAEASLLCELPAAVYRREQAFIGELSLPEIAHLAAGALVYVGNDSGLSHLAAAVGARTATIFGPSDARRYAPRGERALALTGSRRSEMPPQGAAERAGQWDWARGGPTPDETLAEIVALVEGGS